MGDDYQSFGLFGDSPCPASRRTVSCKADIPDRHKTKRGFLFRSHRLTAPHYFHSFYPIFGQRCLSTIPGLCRHRLSFTIITVQCSKCDACIYQLVEESIAVFNS